MLTLVAIGRFAGWRLQLDDADDAARWSGPSRSLGCRGQGAVHVGYVPAAVVRWGHRAGSCDRVQPRAGAGPSLGRRRPDRRDERQDHTDLDVHHL